MIKINNFIGSNDNLKIVEQRGIFTIFQHNTDMRGYNTAVLAEISTRMNKNIELVQVDSLGRAAALVSGAVDAVFWTRTNHASNEWAEMSAEERATDHQSLAEEMSEEEAATHEQFHQLIDFESYGKMDMPEGTIISDSYYSDVLVPIWFHERVKREG